MSMYVQEKIMKKFFAATVGMASVLSCGVALAQSGNMMNNSGMWGSGWMGGYGGGWLPILLVIVIIGLVVWVISQKRK